MFLQNARILQYLIRKRRLSPALSTRMAHSTQIYGQRLQGKVAIVTGGTNGIGLAISKRLAQEGAHVVVSSRKQENVDKAVKELQDLGLKVSGMPCHVAKPEERKCLLENTAKDLGRINILVQNAGVNPHPKDIMDTPPSAIDKTYEVHIKANFMLIQEIVPYMEKNEDQSSIVLTSSISGYRGDIFSGAYGITKAAIFSMVKAFMPALIARNIRINCLSIGVFDTDFMAEVKKEKLVLERALRNIPMGRLGKAAECAGLAAYLCSNDASYVTGENFQVAGGGFSRL